MIFCRSSGLPKLHGSAERIYELWRAMMSYVLLTLLMLVGMFLMFVILLQRGRGGGLAGAFGGLGGQSAFGTKAGDVFTVITIVTVGIWVVLACVTAWRLRYEQTGRYLEGEEGADAVPFADEPDAGKTKKAGATDKSKDTDEKKADETDAGDA